MPRWLLALLLVAGAVPQAAAETYTVVVNHAPPYRIIEKTGTGTRYYGIYVDIMTELARRTGISIRFEEAPFMRALVLLQQGGADLMLGPNRVPEREAYMLFLEVELTAESKAFYIRDGAADIAAYDDLEGKRIAVLRGSVYFDRFDQDRLLDKVALADYLTALRILESGRVDTVIAPELLGDYLIRENALGLRKASYQVAGRPSHIAVSGKSPLSDRRDGLEAALRSMTSDGTIARILDSYRQ